jgi:putative colanic acid biosynthesis acetyltransferase WcaF
VTRLLTPYINPSPGIRAMLWRICSASIYRLIPSPAYRLRRAVLVAFGAQLDRTSRVRGGVRISCPWNLRMGRKSSIGEGATIWAHAPITIGSRSVISQYCVVSSASLRHSENRDHESPDPIVVGDDVWVAAESVILGGTIVPNGALVGARSLVDAPLEPWMIATGHPAKSRRARPYQGVRS